MVEHKKKYAGIRNCSASKFIAIRVGQGDAFFTEKGDMAFLVDGGRSISSFPCQFLRATGRNHIDVLTCTHNDSDHGNGVLGFLLAGLKAEEVWLPASWLDRLEDIILRPEGFLKELVEDIEELPEDQVMGLSQLGDKYATETRNKDSRVVEVGSQELYRAFEQVSDMEWFSTLSLGYGFPPTNKRKMFVEAVSGAKLIREIALAAYLSGSLIKWFDFIGDKNLAQAAGGIRDVLIPVNAVEVAQIRRPKRGALKYIALTRSNKQSLVFTSPKTKDDPGVLFTADSNLRFYQQISWHEHMIITAPHHGSEANQHAYSIFKNETGGMDVSWVRSDGRFSKRPGKSFLTINNRKFCTLCRNSRLPKQDVRLVMVTHSWHPLHTRKCICQ